MSYNDLSSYYVETVGDRVWFSSDYERLAVSCSLQEWQTAKQNPEQDLLSVDTHTYQEYYVF